MSSTDKAFPPPARPERATPVMSSPASPSTASPPFLPFSRPSITADDIAAVTKVLQSGWITTGAQSAELERQFAAAIGTQHAVALTSATAGMHPLLPALNIGPRAQGVTPPMALVSTVNLIALARPTPVFAAAGR